MILMHQPAIGCFSRSGAQGSHQKSVRIMMATTLTLDGLVLPSVVALAALVRGESLEDAAKQGSEALAVTRTSRVAQLEFSQVYIYI